MWFSDLLNCFGRFYASYACWAAVFLLEHILNHLWCVVFHMEKRSRVYMLLHNICRLAQINQHANIWTVAAVMRLWHGTGAGLALQPAEEKMIQIRHNRVDLDNRQHTCSKKAVFCLNALKTECLCGQQLVQLFSNWSAAWCSMSWIEVGA